DVGGQLGRAGRPGPALVDVVLRARHPRLEGVHARIRPGVQAGRIPDPEAVPVGTGRDGRRVRFDVPARVYRAGRGVLLGKLEQRQVAVAPGHEPAQVERVLDGARVVGNVTFQADQEGVGRDGEVRDGREDLDVLVRGVGPRRVEEDLADVQPD